MNKLYKFNKCFHRHGNIEGLFIAKSEDVNDKLIGNHVYFGEVLGKHSNIGCVINKEDITELDVLDTTIDDMLRITGESISGYNPFDYLEEEN